MVTVITRGGLQSRGTASQISGAIFRAPSPKTQARVRKITSSRRGGSRGGTGPQSSRDEISSQVTSTVSAPTLVTPGGPSSRTISQQISQRAQRDPGTIREFRPQDFSFDSGLRRGLPEATGTFVRSAIPQFVTGVGPAIGQALKGRRDTISEINPFRAFEFTGRRGGEATTFVPEFGTVTPQAPTGFGTTTRFQQVRQARQEAGVPTQLLEAPTSVIVTQRAGQIGRELTGTFQERVNLGQLTVPQAEQQAGEEFQRRLERETRQVRGIETASLFRTTGQRVARGAEVIAPTAALIGLSITGPVGATTAGAIGLAGSQQLGVESGRRFRGGDLLGAGASLGQAALFAFPGERLISGAIGPGTSSTIGRQLTQGRLSQLERTTFSLGGDIFEGSRGSVGRFTLSRGTGVASQEVEVLAPVFRQASTPGGTQQFSIVGGRFVSTTRVSPFNLPGGRDVIRLTESGVFTGRGGVGSAARLGRGFEGAQLLGTVDDSIQPAIGTIDIPRDSRVIRSGFGGLSSRQGDTVEILSGRLTSARIPGPSSAQTLQTFRTTPTLRGSARISQPNILDFVPEGAPSTGGFSIGDSARIQKGFGIGSTGGARGLKLTSVSTQDLGIKFGQGTITRQGPDLAGVSLQAAGRVAQTARLSLPISGARSFIPLIDSGGLVPQRLELQSERLSFQSQITDLSFGGGGLSTTGRSGTSFDSRQTASLRSGLESGTRSELDTRNIQRNIQLSIQLPDTRTITRTVQETRLSPRLATEQRLSTELIQAPGFGFGGPTAIGSGFGAGGLRGFAIGDLPGFSIGSFDRAPRRGRTPRVRVAPSFTGLALFDLGGITGGPLPQGILPEVRLVPGRKKKKKSSKKKKR